MNHRTDIQRFVEKRMDVGCAFTLAEELQDEFNVLPLFGEDRFKQRADDVAADVFPGYLRVGKSEIAIALLQVHQSVQLVFMAGGIEFGGQRLFEIGVVGEDLQALGRGVEISLVMVDHQRPGQFDVGGVLAQTHGFEVGPPGRHIRFADHAVQGVEFSGRQDFRFALEHQICTHLIL